MKVMHGCLTGVDGHDRFTCKVNRAIGYVGVCVLGIVIDIRVTGEVDPVVSLRKKCHRVSASFDLCRQKVRSH